MIEKAESSPKVFSTMNIVLAVGLHVFFFGVCALVAACSFEPKETIIPMDLTLVVQENLDGNDDEPPPDRPIPPEQPPPPKPKVDTPPPPPQIKDPPDALVKINDKKKPEDKKKDEKKEEKKKEEKKPEKPKMTREQRLEEMRKRATTVKPKEQPAPPKPVTNGRTGKKTLSDEEIQKRLMQGYKAGRTEQLAGSEEQRCVSLIYRAFYDKWEAPAYSSTLRDIILTVTFDMNGRVVDWRIKSGSGEAAADATVKRAAALVKSVPGLSDSFLRANKTVDIRFTVKPQ